MQTEGHMKPMPRLVSLSVIYALFWLLIDALLFGLAAYGFINLIAALIPVSDRIIAPVGFAIVVGLFFAGKLLAAIIFPRHAGWAEF